jgi:hypothetical protein
MSNKNALPLSAFLLKFFEYKTPKKITDYIDNQKLKCLIENPPYVFCENTK